MVQLNKPFSNSPIAFSPFFPWLFSTLFHFRWLEKTYFFSINRNIVSFLLISRPPSSFGWRILQYASNDDVFTNSKTVDSCIFLQLGSCQIDTQLFVAFSFLTIIHPRGFLSFSFDILTSRHRDVPFHWDGLLFPMDSHRVVLLFLFRSVWLDKECRRVKNLCPLTTNHNQQIGGKKNRWFSLKNGNIALDRMSRIKSIGNQILIELDDSWATTTVLSLEYGWWPSKAHASYAVGSCLCLWKMVPLTRRRRRR